ncbi:hypothetical protein EKO27_g1331 [Xylaria grammica]|uniref:J domain-containing protein n=1 Tax=Xylaria grammica TaxID=363999 RepID=A0A439DH80_9PEZI|nr:hypothetical protein EKO27_g1331 [Xylaria grammica]
MPKWDKTRNYYADLELQSSASPDEIKRQFKKLALKYHPDRNPGREAEVNPKFQIIQSAHEILTDETLKRQYDEARRSYAARYPGASGVKGNPWRDVAKGYPPPPQRQQNAQARPASGAQRYKSFTSSMPQHARPHTPKDDPQFRRSNADAWDYIRPNSTRRNTQARPATPGRAPPGKAPTSANHDPRPGPAPFTPRTAYQKQKQDAAFGTSKKTGFTPRSPNLADEPPVTNKNYFTNRTHSNLFTEPDAMPEASAHTAENTAAADPFAQFKDHFMDNRQRTPYHTPGGERTSLFDSNPGLGRSTSTRTPPRAFEVPGAFPRARPRSSSPARSSSNDGGSEDSVKVNININGATNRGGTTAQSRTGERYKPQMQTAADIPPQPATTSREPASSSNTARPDGSGPSVYASQTVPNYFQSQSTTSPSQRNRHPGGSGSRRGQVADGQRQQQQHTPSNFTVTNNGEINANDNGASSFSFPNAPNATSTGVGHKPFSRNSTENINTRFVDDEMLEDWQFKAGSASANEAAAPSRPRPPSRTRPTRRPLSKPPLPARASQVQPAQEMPDETKAVYEQRIYLSNQACQFEEVQVVQNDCRTLLTPSPGPPPMMPDAMDIDTPPAEKAKPIPKPAKVNSARTYFAEPHREDWRAGDVNGVASKSAGPTTSLNGTKGDFSETKRAQGATEKVPSQHLGSEDTEEFRTTFSDFKKVEPFMDPSPSGLKSFADLKSTLPFESQPSEQIPLEIKPPAGLLEFPIPPVAPRLPPTVSVLEVRPNMPTYRKYIQDFYNYMEKWEAFDDKVLTHFATRQAEFKSRRSRRGANWLEDGASEYLTEIDQDLDVQKKHHHACAEHRKRIAEFMEFRDRVR